MPQRIGEAILDVQRQPLLQPVTTPSAINLRATAQSLTTGAGTTAVVTKPAGTVDGDAMVLIAGSWFGSTITPPAGWTALDTACRNPSAGTDPRLSTFVRVASGEGANYTVTFGVSGDVRLLIIASYTGVDPTTPVDAHGANFNPASVTPVANGITTAVNGDQLVAAYMVDNPGNIIPPAGMTERAEQTDGVSGLAALEICDVSLPVAGATGNKTAGSGNGTSACALIALRPAGGGSGGGGHDTIGPFDVRDWDFIDCMIKADVLGSPGYCNLTLVGSSNADGKSIANPNPAGTRDTIFDYTVRDPAVLGADGSSLSIAHFRVPVVFPIMYAAINMQPVSPTNLYSCRLVPRIGGRDTIQPQRRSGGKPLYGFETSPINVPTGTTDIQPSAAFAGRAVAWFDTAVAPGTLFTAALWSTDILGADFQLALIWSALYQTITPTRTSVPVMPIPLILPPRPYWLRVFNSGAPVNVWFTMVPEE